MPRTPINKERQTAVIYANCTPSLKLALARCADAIGQYESELVRNAVIAYIATYNPKTKSVKAGTCAR